jgi:hypothetical protein
LFFEEILDESSFARLDVIITILCDFRRFSSKIFWRFSAFLHLGKAKMVVPTGIQVSSEEKLAVTLNSNCSKRKENVIPAWPAV